MLNSVNLSDKTYDELLSEAIAQIPLYSSEWTNFNISDPGITLLQNLTAFQLLQQEAIDRVPEAVLRKLLKLVGYEARENRPASVLVQAPPEGGPILQPGHRLWSGTIPFETEETTVLSPWGLEAVLVGTDSGERDVTRLLDAATESVAYPFGRQPLSGNYLLCVLSGVPEVGEPLRLWAQVADEELRTPFEDETQIPDFAHVRWQYWTEAGWQDAEAQDETIGFLRSGSVTLRLTGAMPALRDEEGSPSGCALRCLLESASYDRAPRLRMLAAHLFPMVQKETRVCCHVCSGNRAVEVPGRLALAGNLAVFCRETAEGPYYRYQEAPADGRQGRFYQTEFGYNGVTVRFDPDCGHVPCDGADTVRVVCYDNEMIHHRLLGPIYGYDRQVIQLEQVADVIPESLLLMVEQEQRDGETACWFVAPGETGPGGFSYHLRSREAQIVIDEPAGGGRVLLAGCAVTQGERGDLRPCATLEERGGYDGTEVLARYFCPTPGRGGLTSESVDALRLRFSSGMRQPTVAVRAEDWETLVRRTPGLCVHKVKALADTERNLVRIAVKPYTEERFPRLSAAYLDQLQRFLEPRRMLTTRFELCQPQYVPVSVNAVLTFRGMEAHAREAAEALLRELLDHANGPQGFGGWVRFNEIYQSLSALPFVDAVDALSLYPESRGGVMRGSDIQLKDDSLCYPGSIHLTLRQQGR